MLFLGRQTNLYGYSFNDPVNFIDPNGLRPGDSFPTPGEAAGDAINYINPISIGQNTEHGGYVAKNPDGSYSATNPVSGGTAGVSLGSPPFGTVGNYHTHGAHDPRFNSEVFSIGDIVGDILSGQTGYLGTPGGSIQRHRGGKIDKALQCR